MATLEEARKADGEKLNETLNDLMEKVSPHSVRLEPIQQIVRVLDFETVHFHSIRPSTFFDIRTVHFR